MPESIQNKIVNVLLYSDSGAGTSNDIFNEVLDLFNTDISTSRQRDIILNYMVNEGTLEEVVFSSPGPICYMLSESFWDNYCDDADDDNPSGPSYPVCPVARK